VYLKAAALVAGEFRVGHQVLLRKSTDSAYDCTGKVVSVIINGASSVIGVKLLETPSGTYDLDAVNYALIIGNLNAQGAEMPDSIAYDPVEYSNRTQIWRTPLSITRTAKRTKLRTPEQYGESKQEALLLHGLEMEKTIIHGVQSNGIGSNGKPETSTDGIFSVINKYNPSGIYDYYTDATYNNTTWLNGGANFLDEKFATIFKYGRGQKLGIAGVGAILGINKLVRSLGVYELNQTTISYGIKVMEWITPFGSIYLKTHPLFSWQTATTNEILVLEPENLGFRYIDDTFFVSDPEDRKNRNNSRDSTEEEYITEGLFVWDHAETFSRLKGIGLDNPV
jgi:hypothetical protein